MTNNTPITLSELKIYDEMRKAISFHDKNKNKYYPLKLDEFEEKEREITRYYRNILDSEIKKRHTREKLEKRDRVAKEEKEKQERLEQIAVDALMKMSMGENRSVKSNPENVRRSSRLRREQRGSRVFM